MGPSTSWIKSLLLTLVQQKVSRLTQYLRNNNNNISGRIGGSAGGWSGGLTTTHPEKEKEKECVIKTSDLKERKNGQSTD